MASNSTEIEDGFDLGKEQRTERLKWVLFGTSAMVFVLGKFFFRERVGNWILEACGLTILSYGTVLYVHEIQHIRERWLWKGVATSIPVHLALIFLLFWLDIRSGSAIAGILAISFAVELTFILPIFEHFRVASIPRDVSDEEVSRQVNVPPPRIWQATADRLRGRIRPKLVEQSRGVEPSLTIAGEAESDFAKEKREGHLNWSFWVVAVFLLTVYMVRGISLSSGWLYLLKISLFTAYCYGHLLYVEQQKQIRESWVWKMVLVTIPFHIALLGIMIGIDKIAPYLASNAIVFLFLIWAFGWVEMKLVDQITDDFQP